MVLLIPLNILIPIALVIAIITFLIWYLYSKNKKLRQNLVEETTEFYKYENNARILKETSKGDENDFKNLNQYARDFFKEYLNLDYSLTYLELSKIFEEQKKQEYAEFCKLMSDVNYSGKRSKEQIKNLTDKFYKIIEEYKED